MKALLFFKLVTTATTLGKHFFGPFAGPLLGLPSWHSIVLHVVLLLFLHKAFKIGSRIFKQLAYLYWIFILFMHDFDSRSLFGQRIVPTSSKASNANFCTESKKTFFAQPLRHQLSNI